MLRKVMGEPLVTRRDLLMLPFLFEWPWDRLLMPSPLRFHHAFGGVTRHALEYMRDFMHQHPRDQMPASSMLRKSLEFMSLDVDLIHDGVAARDKAMVAAK